MSLNRTCIIPLSIIFFLIIFSGSALPSYKTPPDEVIKIIDSPSPPLGNISPDGSLMLLISQKEYPPIRMLAQKKIPLAGIEINPDNFTQFSVSQNPGLSLVNIENQKVIDLELPVDINIGKTYWSFNSKHFAFSNYGRKGLELFVGNSEGGKITHFSNVRLTNILDDPLTWQKNNKELLIRLVPENIGPPPEKPEVPSGPVIEETSGKFSKVSTYQNLLKNEYDEKLFIYYAQSQLAFLNIETGRIVKLGSPGLYLSAKVSPDGSYILVTKINPPYSHKVPYFLFAKSVEIWDRTGKPIKLVASLSVQEEIPPHGVATGPREFLWQQLHPSKLLWLEALDDGDPLKEVPFRDKLMSLSAPFTKEAVPHEIFKLTHRFSGIQFFPRKDMVNLSEFDRKKQWLTTYLLDLSRPSVSRKILFSRNIHDDYNEPGSSVHQVYDDKNWLIKQDGEWIYFIGKGSSPEGERPFLHRFNIISHKKEIIFQSDRNSYERVVSLYRDNPYKIVTRRESVREPPNYFLVDIEKKKRYVLTHYVDPTPELRAIKTELIKYKRKDGVELSGMLYLPADYKPGLRLPLVLWAYPYDYSDISTAGQVRGSPNRFTFIRGASQLSFLTQGYAVLNNAAMPVVGDPETKNDTFIEQIVSSAEAAINYLDSRGIIDPERVLVGGHSYGAFMTANLLAHTRLFAAGIARSGAYNRTLTPFGFQNERRSFWEAPDIYMKLSPFTYADKIKDPLLIIHGEDDDNSGTFPFQSKRLYAAINGNGGTARLVLLPLEGHIYAGRESILHVIAEMIEWGEQYVKNKK